MHVIAACAQQQRPEGGIGISGLLTRRAVLLAGVEDAYNRPETLGAEHG